MQRFWSFQLLFSPSHLSSTRFYYFFRVTQVRPQVCCEERLVSRSWSDAFLRRLYFHIVFERHHIWRLDWAYSFAAVLLCHLLRKCLKHVSELSFLNWVSILRFSVEHRWTVFFDWSGGERKFLHAWGHAAIKWHKSCQWGKLWYVQTVVVDALCFACISHFLSFVLSVANNSPSYWKLVFVTFVCFSFIYFLLFSFVFIFLVMLSKQGHSLIDFPQFIYAEVSNLASWKKKQQKCDLVNIVLQWCVKKHVHITSCSLLVVDICTKHLLFSGNALIYWLYSHYAWSSRMFCFVLWKKHNVEVTPSWIRETEKHTFRPCGCSAASTEIRFECTRSRPACRFFRNENEQVFLGIYSVSSKTTPKRISSGFVKQMSQFLCTKENSI